MPKSQVQGYELGMFHFIAMDWPKAHEHLNCVYVSVNSDKDHDSSSDTVIHQCFSSLLECFVGTRLTPPVHLNLPVDTSGKSW